MHIQLERICFAHCLLLLSDIFPFLDMRDIPGIRSEIDGISSIDSVNNWTQVIIIVVIVFSSLMLGIDR